MTRTRPATLALLPVVLSVLLLAACARFGAGGAGSPTPVPSPEPDPTLAGTWVLVSGHGPGGTIEVPAGWQVTLIFNGDEVGGQACNHYGGTYELDGSRISFSAMSMTEMACEEPMMSVEAAYHAALLAVDRVELEGDSLTLTAADAELSYTRQAPVADADLVGTDWVLDTLIDGDAASSVIGDGRLLLTDEGRISGSTGCRLFDGEYAAAGSSVTVTQLITTMNPCDETNGGQDGDVLGVIDGTFTFSIEGDRLTISNGQTGLVYRAEG
jgi:heat shock protein HslJ